MNQEKAVHFSVIKQKIIKTDEVLHRYVETNTKLKSVQETCKAIKLKYDQTVHNLSRLQLENERCTFNLGNVKLKCELLEKENEKLQEQNLTLEDKYNKQTIQSQLNIRELEDQLRMVQEIKTTVDSFSPKKKRGLSIINENDKKIKELEDKIKQLEESKINSKNEVTSLNVENKKLSNDIIITEKKHSDIVKKLQNENSNLLEELNRFKCQINKANSNLEVQNKHEATLEHLNKEKDIEISELRKKIFTLIADENRLKIVEEENEMLKQKLMDQEINTVNTKKNICTKDICSQTDEVTKTCTRSIRSQTLESMKTLSQQNLISMENRKLKQTILDRDTEIFKLKAKPKISTNSCHTQTDVLDVESVEDILTEMRMPFSMLSPMRSSCENLNLDDTVSPIPGDINDSCSVQSDIPDIVITPPTPVIEKNFEKFINDKTSCVPPTNSEDVSPIEQSEIINTDTSKNSEVLENKEVKDNFKKVPRRKSFISDSFVKLRKSSLKRLLNKRYVFKKEMRRVRKLSKQDCILKALRTLKHSNINFTISNESNIPKWWTNCSNYESFKYPEVPPDTNLQRVNSIRKTSISTKKYKSMQYITEKLSCTSKNCNNGNSCMLLNNVHGITELLGFFNVKNENITPSNSRMGNIVDNHLNSLKSLNLTNGSKITPENLLETLADLVSQKLREKKNSSKRKQKSALHKSDSFYSETETEIERLFANPDDDVLKRNKMLLKKAKQQNLKELCLDGENVSGKEYTVTDEGVIQSKLAHGSEESEGSETEINSFGLAEASGVENKNTSNTTDPNPASECMESSSDTLKNSTQLSESNKKMVMLPSAKSVKEHPSECTESTKKEKKLKSHEDSKLFTASANYTIFNERTESCDSFQYSECPEIISPLSSIIGMDSPGSKTKHRSLQTEETWLKEMEMSPLSPKCLKFSNQNVPDSLNTSQSNNDKCLMKSPVSSALVNKYKLLSEQRNNFERYTSLIEACTTPKKFEIADKQEKFTKGRKDFVKDDFLMEKNEFDNTVTHIKPSSVIANYSLNVNETAEQTVKNTIVEVNQNISSIKNQSYNMLVTANLSLKESQETLQKFSNKGEENSITTKLNHVTRSSSPLNMSTVEFLQADGKFQCNVDSREFRQFEHEIPFSDSIFPDQCKLSSSPIRNITKEILNVLPDVENVSNNSPESDQIEDIPSYPQSPINDSEEHKGIQLPKIIPLERLFKQDPRIGLEESNIENMPMSHNFSKQEERMKASGTKIISHNNDHTEQLKQVILNAFPKEENTLNRLSGTSKIEKMKIEDITSCPQSPNSDYEEHMDIKIPKIIPLKRLFEQDAVIDLEENATENMSSWYLSKQKEEIKASEILDAIPKEENISSCLSKSNEFENINIEDIPSCPQSSISDQEEDIDITIPKIIPLKRFEEDPMIGLDENNTEDMLTYDDFVKQEKIIEAPETKIISSNNDPNEQLKQIILHALPKEENTLCRLSETNKIENIKIEDIPSCPQSPNSDYEEDVDIKIPKMIPLKRLFEQDAMVGLEENSTENMSTLQYFSKPKEKIKTFETKVISSNNNHNEQFKLEVLDALPKEENTSSRLSKTNETENIKIEDNLSCPQSPNSDYEDDALIGLDENSTEDMPTSDDFVKQEKRIEASEKIISSNNNHNEQLKQVILDTLANEENISSRLSEISGRYIPSCPQSPNSDYEEHMDIKIPKMIPLKRLFERDPVTGLGENSSGNMSTSHHFVKQDEGIEDSETNIISSNDNYNEQLERLILDALPKKENTLSKTNEIENINIEDIPSCPQSPISDYEEHVDIKGPKIIPLKRLFEEDNTENMPTFHDFPKQEQRIEAFKPKTMSTNNNSNGQFKEVILDALPKEKNTSSLSNTNDIETMESKTMLLEKLDNHDIEGDFDKGINTDDTPICSNSPEVYNKSDKLMPVPSLNNNQKNHLKNIALDSTDNEECQATKSPKTATSSSLRNLRRSKRICKKISYSELPNGSSSESCETDNISERLAGNSKSSDVPKISQVDPNSCVESQFFNESVSECSSTLTEISKPIKKKRGRPRKLPVVESKYEEIKALPIDQISCNEEPLHPKKPYHEEHKENTILCIEPEEKISNDENKELSQKENLITDLCKGPVEENIKSNIFVNEELDNAALKSDVISESTSDIVPGENKITKLREKHELHNELTDTSSKEITLEYSVAKEKQVNKEAVVRRQLKSPDILISKKTSDLASEEKSTTTSYSEKNEFHIDMAIDETDSKEMRGDNEKEEQQDKNAVDAVILKLAFNSKSSDVFKIPQVDPNSCVESQFSNKSASECSSKFTEISKLTKRKRGRPRKLPVMKSKYEVIKAFSINQTNCNEEPLHPKELNHEKHQENNILCTEPEKKISKDESKELSPKENSITNLCIEPVEENMKSNMLVNESNSEIRSDVISESTSDNVLEENKITKLREKHELHNELLTDTSSKEITMEYTVAKERQVNKEAIVRRQLKSPDILISQKMSDMACEEKSTATSCSERNEFHIDMAVDETYSKEIRGDNNEKEEQQDKNAVDPVILKLACNSKSSDVSKILQVDPNSCVESHFSNKSESECSSILTEISKLTKRKRGRPRKLPVVKSKYEVIKAFSINQTNCNEEPIHLKEPYHEKHQENTILCTELEKNISKDESKELSQKENSITDLCIEPVEENTKSNMLLGKSNSDLKSDVASESTSDNVLEENKIPKLREKHELHNELLTDTSSKEIPMEYSVAKEKQVNEEAVVKKRNLKSLDILISKKMSDMVSEEKSVATTYSETNEFCVDLRIDETNSNEISNENNEKEEHLDNKNAIDPVLLKKISDIILKEKRKIKWETNVPNSGLLSIGANTEGINDKNNETEEKLLGKNIVRKRKIVSRLKSNIIKQFKMKRKMFQMDVQPVKKANACDLKINPNSNRSIIKKINLNVGSCSKSNRTQGSNISQSTNVDNNETNSDDKRIHIVQNILIPANSYYAVDLMEKKKCAESKFPLNCDIRLDVTQTSSQSEVKFCKPLHKKKIADRTDDSNIPLKKKRIVPVKSGNVTNENSDILSKIMGEMDKDKPNNTLKAVATPSIPKQTGPTSIEDKEWRKGIMTIAESIYNVAPEKEGFKRPTNPNNHPKKKPSTKHRILMSRLTKLSTEDNIPDEIIVEFKRQTVDDIAGIILQRVSQDITDKPEEVYYSAPLMTKTQRILLALMVRLENENVSNVLNTFLSKVDTLFFMTGCGIRSMIPITRLYMAVCRLQADIDKMRNFCCDAFYFMGDLAIPLLFTVLTSWIEVLPKEPDLKYYPLAKVLVQIVHLKCCNTPGYNLLPLRFLLHQYHEYPKERWNCDELFAELYQQYLRNPVKSAALQLLCKNKDAQWTFKKVDEFLKPLVYKIPADNVNFKATVIVLIGDICSQSKPKNKSDEAYCKDLQWWLNGLIEEEEESYLIERSVDYSLKKLRKHKFLKKDNRMKIVDKMKNRESKQEEFEKKENDKQF